jgi:hypothetical protein
MLEELHRRNFADATIRCCGRELSRNVGNSWNPLGIPPYVRPVAKREGVQAIKQPVLAREPNLKQENQIWVRERVSAREQSLGKDKSSQGITMPNALKRMNLALCLVLLSAGPAFTETASDQATTAATTTAPAAYVYVQTNAGVNVYDGNSSGQLTLVKGSPFAESGQMEGVNGSYLISVGTDDLHSYKIGTDGAVGSQASEIDTQSYGGSECGTTIDASILDHTGQYFSVQLADTTASNDSCSALQTYKIASSGDFTYLGDTVSTDGVHGSVYQQAVSTYSSNDVFAYGSMSTQGANVFDAFKRASAGDLVANTSFTQSGPTPNPSLGTYEPWAVAADPASHLAAVVYTPFGDSTTMQLASYTINNSTGAVSSTNTYKNMPVVEGYPITINMSPAGNLLAVGAVSGLEIFHFNGAAVPTAYSGALLPNVEIDQLGWDDSNHLYALSYSSGELYVYTVTATSISEAAGSPYLVKAPYGFVGMIVVPK